MLEIQFNWAFIVIVGAFILVFFSGIAIYQKSVSEKRYANNVLNQLESMFVSYGVISSSVSNLTLGNLEVIFDCENCYCNFRTSLDKESQGRSYKDAIIFAPRSIKGRKMMVLAEPWNAPFKVANFIYVTSPEVLYVFVYNKSDQMSISMKEKFSGDYNILASITKDFIDYTSLAAYKYNNNYKTRFVFLGIVPSKAKVNNSFIGKDFSAVYIEPASDFSNKARIAFYSSDSNGFRQVGKQSYILGDASAYAAIFSEEQEAYDCNMDKAVERISRLGILYSKRSEMIADSFGNGSCANIHRYSGFQMLANLSSFSSNVSQISNAWKSIESRNMDTKGVGELRRCPYLY